MSYFKETIKDHGIALLIIIVMWEIVEDIGFPILFIWLGKNIHPAFLAGAPASWLLCLHWLVVPFFWGIWIKFSKGNKKQFKHECNHEH